MRVKNKVTLITGAGSGIGKETALLFAKEGAKLVLTDVAVDAVQETEKEVKELGAEAISIKHDVSKEEDWQKAVEKAVDQFGTIDVLFNNAGIYIIKPITELELDTWNKLMAINVTGTFLGMKHVLPVMQKQNSGSIINASSVAGLRGAPGHALYGASKGAVRIMTKDVAMEVARQQIRVNSIHPGYIDTQMADYGAEQQGTTTEELGEDYPLGRLGKRSEVAKTVLFLASDDSSYTTGAEFPVDGGATSSL
ncbi:MULTISPECIES: SDR family NAD(P)-dependent oxidoreductase [Gracilibacillus]|uniref:SDR family NAD(P)-dependent oxidoreductase n=1 Tax=Gracilibacillus TaxID=74385 RepID=UPI000825BAB3|nr:MULTISPECIES: glucose 1-dehydrogenase [Gracilibacillus]